MAIVPDANVEGPIAQLPNLSGDQLTLIVAGVTVIADLNTIIRTPTRQLNLVEVADPTPFPGRADPGFVKGSAQADGSYDTTNGVLRADRLFLEPGEHVLVGPIANPTEAGAIVNGVNAELTNDTRIPSYQILNEFGFPIQPASIPVDSTTAAEGYYDGNILRAFAISVDAPDAILKINPIIQPQISLLRARAVEKDSTYRLDIRGAVTLHHSPGFQPQEIDVYRLDDNNVTTFLGRARTRRAPGTSFGKYDQEFRNLPGEPPTCIRVINTTAMNQPSADLYVDL
ncbi:MAG: hypothetical protein LM517_06755 [Nitrosomonas sp.]|nr:hypothetical protein [Nitrosomonas sp.]